MLEKPALWLQEQITRGEVKIGQLAEASDRNWGPQHAAFDFF